jgi:hypothetical protein
MKSILLFSNVDFGFLLSFAEKIRIIIWKMMPVLSRFRLFPTI